MSTRAAGEGTEGPPRWSSPEGARRYASLDGERSGSGRWRSARRRDRDPRIVHELLTRSGLRPGGGPILDVPCGAGRLRAALESFGLGYRGVDVSSAMLSEASGLGDPGALVAAALPRLPFADESFQAVVACRYLHHLPDDAALRAAVAELVRVSSGVVVASFWDAASLAAWRRRHGFRAAGTRVARSKVAISEAFAAAGATVVAFRHSFRFVSPQTFALAVKRRDRAPS